MTIAPEHMTITTPATIAPATMLGIVMVVCVGKCVAVGVMVVLDRRERCGRPLGCDRFPEVLDIVVVVGVVAALSVVVGRCRDGCGL